MRSLGRATLILLCSLSLSACISSNSEGDNLSSTGLNSLWNKFTGSNANRELLANNTVHFGFDRYNITDQAKDTLQVHTDYLLAHPEAKLRIEGHTDIVGNPNYNVGLSERRAAAVSNYLVLKGVSPSQIELVSYGSKKLAVEANGKEADSLNRRAELVYETIA